MTTIHVSPEDIVNGKQGFCNTCPVARAMNRVLKPDFPVRVFPFRIHIGPHSYNTPISVLNFIMDFDKGVPTQPFTFDIDLHADILL